MPVYCMSGSVIFPVYPLCIPNNDSAHPVCIPKDFVVYPLCIPGTVVPTTVQKAPKLGVPNFSPHEILHCTN